MIDINSLTIEQAKQLAYDEREKMDIVQNNLSILRQIIAQRSKDSNSTENVIQPKDEGKENAIG